MNLDGTLDPRLLLRINPSQPQPNILSMQDALKLAAGVREATQVKSKPKTTGATSRRTCNRCGKSGHTAIEISGNGQYKCPIRRAETLLPAAQIQLLHAQASAELEALKNSQSPSTPSSHPPSNTSSLPADQFNRNWRIYSLIEPRKWNQPLPPKKREHYIEFLEKSNQQLPIWKANYFNMYQEMQRGASWRMYLDQTGSMRMAKLHAANVRLMRAAKAKSRAESGRVREDVAK